MSKLLAAKGEGGKSAKNLRACDYQQISEPFHGSNFVLFNLTNFYNNVTFNKLKKVHKNPLNL